MSSISHVDKFNHNHGFYLWIVTNNKYLDWQIITLFYSALHLIEEYLIRYEGQTFKSHIKRHHYLNTSSRIDPGIVSDYLLLYQLSHQSRYQLVSMTQTDLSNAQNLFGNIMGNMRRLYKVG